MPKADKETQEIQKKGRALADMVESAGWGYVEPALKEKILDLQNINNIESTEANEVLAEIKARKMAADILYQWLKIDVYGDLEQTESNEALMPDYIDRRG